MSRLVSAEEARKLLDGATPGPWGDAGFGAVCPNADEKEVAVTMMPWEGDTDEEGDCLAANIRLVAAAPDLAATVVALSEERDAYRAFAHRIAEIMAPPDAVDMAAKHLEFHGLDDLAETVADTLENRAKNGRLAGLEEAAQVCSERANTREAAAEEMHKAGEYSDATLYRTYATAERSIALTLAARAKVPK